MLARKPLTVAQAERICKWYYRAGFAGLPWLWFVTWLLFRQHTAVSETIAWYTTASLRLSIVGGVLLVAWYVTALAALPATSSLFVIPPFTGKWHPGYFAA